MNWRHLQTFVWLRWRLMINQARRAGTVNAVLMIAVVIAVVATAIPLLIGSFALGLYAIPRATPTHLLFAWDAILVAFLFFWSIGLITELQRSEPMSLSKVLHLPVSANGAFLINYLSSLLRLSLITFVPLMLGFALALVYVKGIALLVTLPLLAAFLLMVTALTYQFQGWLASLMNNPRRRRTIVMATTALFILIFQVPNLLNFYAPWGTQQRAADSRALVAEMARLERAFKAGEFDVHEYVRRQNELMKTHKERTDRVRRESLEQWTRIGRVANLVLPVGWLALGVMSAAEGGVVPPILGIAGMSLIGAVSLARAYRTMVAQYQGQSSNRSGRTQPVAQTGPRASAVGTAEAAHRPLLLERRIPWLSEPVAAIALGGFRSLLRSPEAKMALISPLIMIAIFGSMMLGGRQTTPELVRPLFAMGGMGLVLLSLLQLSGNQFGMDRDGFRVFVLSAASRRDILLGKNLACAPFVLAMGCLVTLAVQVVCPMRLDHFLAVFPQFVSMYILFCVFANLTSIYTPVFLAAGTLRPATVKLSTVLMQMLVFLVFMPIAQILALLPLGVEALLEYLGWTRGFPVYLILSLVEAAGVVALWGLVLDWQGRLLQGREQQILETVTNRAP